MSLLNVNAFLKNFFKKSTPDNSGIPYLLAPVEEENCNILPGINEHYFKKTFVSTLLSVKFIANQQISLDLVIA